MWIRGFRVGLDVTSVDVPSVSPIPAGPGTPACSSLVLWLGWPANSKLTATLPTIAEARDLELLQVTSTVPGKAVPVDRGSPFVDVRPSGKSRPSLALVPSNFTQARAIQRALAAAVPNAADVRLHCAVPRIAKRLGIVGRDLQSPSN